MHTSHSLAPHTLARLQQAADKENISPDELINRMLDAHTQQPVLSERLKHISPVLDALIDGYFVVNRQWQIVYMGESTAKTWGVNAQEVVGKTGLEIFPGATEIPFQQRWENAFEQNVAIEFTDFHPHLKKWMTFYGIPIDGHMVACFRNMDETIQREQMLMASEFRLKAITQNFPVIIYTLDKDGVFTYSVGKGLEKLGLKDGEVVGQSAYKLYASDIEAIEKMKRAFAGEEVFTTVQFGDAYFNVWDVPLWGKDGDVEGVLGVGIDLTDQREAEVMRREKDRLEHENEVLRRLNSMKTRFMNMVSHEFRTPLTVIQSSADILERYSDRLSDEKRSRHRGKIMTQVRHLINMLSRMERGLEVSAVPPIAHRMPVEVSSLISGTVEHFREVNTDRRYNLVYTGTPRTTHIDVDLMGEALYNLLENATKYAKPDTDVTVTVHYGEQLEIHVRDEGIGIAQADLENVFEPFFRAHQAENVAGTGIGLNIARYAVDAHGGTIGIESKPDDGTTVSLKIPYESTVQRK